MAQNGAVECDLVARCNGENGSRAFACADIHRKSREAECSLTWLYIGRMCQGDNLLSSEWVDGHSGAELPIGVWIGPEPTTLVKKIEEHHHILKTVYKYYIHTRGVAHVARSMSNQCHAAIIFICFRTFCLKQYGFMSQKIP